MKPSASCRVLIAVEPAAFGRLIEHVLHGHPGLQVIGRTSRSHSLGVRAGRLAPDVIIANTRLKGNEPRDVSAARSALADLKRSSPASILIQLTHDLDEPALRRAAWPQRADACLPEDAVVRQLLPMIRKLVARVADPIPDLAQTRRRS